MEKWDTFENKFWVSWDDWDKWDKNGKFLFNLTVAPDGVAKLAYAEILKYGISGIS